MQWHRLLITGGGMDSGKDNRHEKLFGKYHEIALMVLGFFLTTIVAGGITFWYQKKAWDRDDLSKRKQEEINRASVLFDDLSRLLDKRLYRLRNVQWALEGEKKASQEELAALRAQYRAIIVEWNESLNRNLALTERYFGSDVRSQLEGSISGEFIALHKELKQVLSDPNDENIAQLEAHIDRFNPQIYIFNVRMIELLQRGEVGVFMPNMAK
jgi:hypothetical protein